MEVSLVLFCFIPCAFGDLLVIILWMYFYYPNLIPYAEEQVVYSSYNGTHDFFTRENGTVVILLHNENECLRNTNRIRYFSTGVIVQNTSPHILAFVLTSATIFLLVIWFVQTVVWKNKTRLVLNV